MKKFFAVLMVLGVLGGFSPSSVNASWWYDFTHREDDYQDNSYLEEEEEEKNNFEEEEG